MAEQIKKCPKPWHKKWWVIIPIILFLLVALVSLLPDPPKENKIKNNESPAQNSSSNLLDPEQYYKLLSVADASMFDYSRRAVDIIVPLGLTKNQLSQIMFYVANKIKKEENADRVWVHAYHEQDKDLEEVSAATLDIDDKGNGSGRVEFVSNYFKDSEKHNASQ